MKKLLFLAAVALSGKMAAQPNPENVQQNPRHNIIQLALLLDVSGSMQGLIKQAQTELWSLVNEVSKAKKNDHAARLEIALYIYGGTYLPSENGYIRKVLDYTNDLDTISANLFAIKIDGGDEYCGNVIKDALEQLQWRDNDSMYRVIFIAGNEPFNQGPEDYKKWCDEAAYRGITVNTIHCGDSLVGINEFWKDGAARAKGRYFYINQNTVAEDVQTPYDSLIGVYNDSLNTTYLAYGSSGAWYSGNQKEQDVNAVSISKGAGAKRAYAKSKAIYNNSKWDAVDKSNADSNWVKTAKEEELPAELKGKTADEKMLVIREKDAKRAGYSKQIQDLGKLRDEFIANFRRNAPEKTLGSAITAALRKQAMGKGFQFYE